MIEYLMTQLDRMSEEQRGLVERCATREEGSWLKIERQRIGTLYMWLHMREGSVAYRRF